MRILHLSTYGGREGAARGALSLHRGLRAHGVDSRLLVAHLDAADDGIAVVPRTAGGRWWSRVMGGVESAIVNPRKRPDSGKFSAGISRRVAQRRLLAEIERAKPDLVHLHWVAGGFVPAGTLPRLRVPIVWTLRDLWPLTGGCHYPEEGCRGYESGCVVCPVFRAPWLDALPGLLLRRRRRLWASVPLALVAMSTWVADCARRSVLWGRAPVRLIHNAVDTAVFRPENSLAARRALGLAPDSPILLCGSVNGAADARKGYRFVREGLAQGLLRHSGASERPQFLTFGGDPGPALPEGSAVEHVHLGPIHDDATLSTVYSAADVTVVPSTMETFGKVALESLACGTPVACFDTSGLRDVVQHDITGHRARCFDVADLFEGIRSMLFDRTRRDARGAAARADVIARFTMERQVRRHLELYTQVLAETCPASPSSVRSA